jgi:hypothetical protein
MGGKYIVILRCLRQLRILITNHTKMLLRLIRILEALIEALKHVLHHMRLKLQ